MNQRRKCPRGRKEKKLDDLGRARGCGWVGVFSELNGEAEQLVAF